MDKASDSRKRGASRRVSKGNTGGDVFDRSRCTIGYIPDSLYRSRILSAVYRNANTRLRGCLIDCFGQQANKWILTNNSRVRGAVPASKPPPPPKPMGTRYPGIPRAFANETSSRRRGTRFFIFAPGVQGMICNVGRNRMKIPYAIPERTEGNKNSRSSPFKPRSIRRLPFQAFRGTKRKGERSLPYAFYTRYAKSRVLQ